MGSYFVERFFFHRERGVEIDLRGLHVLVSEPQRDCGSIDTLLEHVDCHGVPQTVNRHAFLFE